MSYQKAKQVKLIFLKKQTSFVFFVTLFCCQINCLANTSNKDASSISFSENKGQWDKKILYRAALDGGALFLEKNAFTYSFYDKELLHKLHLASKSELQKISNTNIRSHAFRINFVNCLPIHSTSSYKPTKDYENYFIGRNRSQWVSNVKKYAQVLYPNLYDKIDMEIIGLTNSIKYNFIVKPNANPEQIKMNYDGLSGIELVKGKLIIKTTLQEITEQEPYAYQWIDGKKIDVPCKFILNGTTISFGLGNYNKNYELVIDPILIFGSYSGSTADNFGMTATYDNRGHLYAGGTAFATGYPITVGAFDPTYNGIVQSGRTDVVITKYDSAGTSLIYSTYIGGANSTEVVSSLIVNDQNELLLYGATGSNDFPVTPNAYDTTFAGGTAFNNVPNGTNFQNGTDLYIAKFDAAGSSLIGCTYVGGTKNDGVNSSGTLAYNYGDYYRGEITLDPNGNCYIASFTYSLDFPTVNPFQAVQGGGIDGVVFKMNPLLTTLIWSSYIGGTGEDGAYAIAVDDSSVSYVTGGTSSGNFPTTLGSANANYLGGSTDGFIAKINKTGTAILSASYIGTPLYDQCFFVQLDKKKRVYLVGQTLGAFPVSGGVYSNPNSGQFIVKLDNNLTTYMYSTVFGNGNGIPNISPSAFLVDDCENVYVSGWGGHILNGTPTNNMPLTNNAFQNTTDGFNFYLIVFSQDIQALIYATYFGGATSQEHVDGGTSRFDKKGIVYQSVCAGCGSNDDFPTTVGAWSQTNNSNNCNNGVFKFDFQVKLASSEFTTSYQSQCAPATVQFNNTNPNTQSFLWDFGNNDTTSLISNPIRTYNNPGTYLVILIVNDTSSCNKVDTSFQYITIYPPLVADFNFTILPCTNFVQFLDSSTAVGDTAAIWAWDFGDGQISNIKNPQHTYNANGTYNVTLISSTANGCADTVVVQVVFDGVVANVNADTTICQGTSAQLNASGGFAYSWSPATGLSNTNIPNPTAAPNDTTTYTVVVSVVNSNGDTCLVTLTTTVNVVVLTVGNATLTSDRDTIFKGESVQLTTTPNNANSYTWLPVEGLSDPSISNPIATPLKTTTYTVFIAGQGGCGITKQITIVVLSNICDEPDIFIPNTFTPNGDGNNDIFNVRGNNIEVSYLSVYNRWGEKVFDSNDKKTGWNGTYKNKASKPDVFAYYVKIKCYNGKEYFKKGNVTLIR